MRRNVKQWVAPATLFAALAGIGTACGFPDFGGFGGAPPLADGGGGGMPATSTTTASTTTSTGSSSSSGSGGAGGSTTVSSSSSSGSTGGSTSVSSSSSGSTSTSTSVSSSSSSGAGGSTSVSLPLTVSTVFVPSGYMGNGVTANSVVMLPLKPADPQDCGGDRSPTALGTCYTVTYTPVPSGMGWGGVYWQYPADNWGAMPGLDISAGATEVSVWAKGGAGGEQLTIVAGGIQNAAMAHQDTFRASAVATLTTSWARYTLTLPPSYGPVLGGFAWTVNAPTGGGSVQLSIDSIQWK